MHFLTFFMVTRLNQFQMAFYFLRVVSHKTISEIPLVFKKTKEKEFYKVIDFYKLIKLFR